MPFKKIDANQLSHDDIVRVLDLEEENLSADICSQLRQNRYKAIDHAGIIDKRDYIREGIGWTLATAASIALVVFLVNHELVIDKTSVIMASLVKPKAEEELKIQPVEPNSKSDENNQKEEAEDLEIYEWLYNNYG